MHAQPVGKRCQQMPGESFSSDADAPAPPSSNSLTPSVSNQILTQLQQLGDKMEQIDRRMQRTEAALEQGSTQAKNDLKKIMLVGGASRDIQAIANTITGQPLFLQPSSAKDVNSFKVNNREIVVAPGFADYRTDISPKHLKSRIKSSSKMSGDFYAAVVVLNYPIRWTAEESTTVQSTIDIIGEQNLQSVGTLILNNGHDFKTKYPDNTMAKFQEYLDHQKSQVPQLERFIRLFDDRVILLDTELEDEALNGPQLQQFYRDLDRKSFKIEMERPSHSPCRFL